MGQIIRKNKDVEEIHKMETKNNKARNQWDKDLILWKDKQIHKHHCTNQ